MEVYYTRCLIEGNPCLVCIRLRKTTMLWAKDWCRTRVTNKLSSESSMDQMQYGTMCERSI